MKHFASRQFWALYNALSPEVRDLADRNFERLKNDPRHPSLHVKRVGKLWSARIGDHYRVLGHDVPGGIKWFWIGSHADYDKLIG